MQDAKEREADLRASPAIVSAIVSTAAIASIPRFLVFSRSCSNFLEL